MPGGKQKKGKPYAVDPFKEDIVIEAKDKELKDRQLELDKRESELKEMRIKLNDKDLELKKKESLINKRESELNRQASKASDDASEIKKKLKDAERSKTLAVNQMNDALKDCEEQKGLCAEQKIKIESLQKEIESLKSELEAQKDKAHENSKSSTDNDEDISKLKRQLEKQVDLTAYYRNVASNNRGGAVKILEHRVNELENELEIKRGLASHYMDLAIKAGLNSEKTDKYIGGSARYLADISSPRLLGIISSLESQLYRIQMEHGGLSVDNTKLSELKKENDTLKSQLDSVTEERDEAKGREGRG